MTVVEHVDQVYIPLSLSTYYSPLVILARWRFLGSCWFCCRKYIIKYSRLPFVDQGNGIFLLHIFSSGYLQFLFFVVSLFLFVLILLCFGSRPQRASLVGKGSSAKPRYLSAFMSPFVKLGNMIAGWPNLFFAEFLPLLRFVCFGWFSLSFCSDARCTGTDI